MWAYLTLFEANWYLLQTLEAKDRVERLIEIMTESQFIHLESARDQLNSSYRSRNGFLLPEGKTVVRSKAGGLIRRLRRLRIEIRTSKFKFCYNKDIN